MACNFSIDFTGSAEPLIAKASSAISGAGGHFTGDANGGNFHISTPIGKVSGSFSVVGQTIAFSITDKPFLLGCGRIEEELRKYVS